MQRTRVRALRGPSTGSALAKRCFAEPDPCFHEFRLRPGHGIVQEQRPRSLVSSMHPQPNKRVFPLRRARLFHQTREPAMGLFTKDIKTMNDLFVHQLQDIYYAEQQL